MRLQFITFLLMIFNLIAANTSAQNGTVKGLVSTNDGKPAEQVNVIIKGVKTGRIGNEWPARSQQINISPSHSRNLSSFIDVINN